MIDSIACSKVRVKSNGLRWLTGPNAFSVFSAQGAAVLYAIAVGLQIENNSARQEDL
jgi:hypothetical protein